MDPVAVPGEGSMRQCEMRDPDGGTLVAWIPAEHAVIGRCLTLKHGDALRMTFMELRGHRFRPKEPPNNGRRYARMTVTAVFGIRPKEPEDEHDHDVFTLC